MIFSSSSPIAEKKEKSLYFIGLYNALVLEETGLYDPGPFLFHPYIYIYNARTRWPGLLCRRLSLDRILYSTSFEKDGKR